MIFLGYIISFLIGYLLLEKLSTKRIEPFALSFSLSLGLGLAISATLTFLSIVALNQINPPAVIATNLLCLGILIWMSRSYIKTLRASKESFSLPNIVSTIIFTTALILSGFIVFKIALAGHPHGEWDAWAVWNMKTKFLLLGGTNWSNIFKLHWHTQPDYPLLLPSLHSWIACFATNKLALITLLNSVIFTVLTAALVYGSVTHFSNQKWGGLAFLLLIINPMFVFIGTSQYADILLSFFILAAFFLMALALRDRDNGLAFYAMAVVGLSAFVKNEGLLISITALAIMLTINWKRSLKLSPKKIAAGWGLGIIPAALLKLFFAPPNRDMNLESLLSLHQIFNFTRGIEILKALAHSLWLPGWRWTYISILVLIVLATFRRKLNPGALALLAFILCYAFILFFVYATTSNFDLAWRLKRTLSRILFYLLPFFMFCAAYLNLSGQGDENS